MPELTCTECGWTGNKDELINYVDYDTAECPRCLAYAKDCIEEVEDEIQKKISSD